MCDDQINILHADTTHVVIGFINTEKIRRKKKERQVDLLPRSWIIFLDGKWFCYYPDKKLYHCIEEWSRASHNPDKFWDEFKVEILKEARK